MLLPAERRRTLGAFLRSRREALPPARAVPARARRTPGLRREEVAELCGISTAWYTWVEQGRDISLSAAALAGLARALRLTTAERTYLFEVAGQRDPAPAEPLIPGDGVAALVAAIAAPAYVLDRLWRRRAWNADAADLFAPWRDAGEPGLLDFVFRAPAARLLIEDWEDRARRLAAEFRADAARFSGDPELAALVDDLRRESPDFARAWDHHGVLAREGGERRFRHPARGRLLFHQTTLVPAGAPDLKLVVLLPAP